MKDSLEAEETRTVEERVRIHEVAPRDGLQDEPAPLPVRVRVRLVRLLAAAGVASVEVGAFVRADRVPAMAGTAEVAAALAASPPPGVRLTGLVPNLRGFRDLLATGLRDADLVLSVSDAHNRANLGRSTARSLEEAREILALAGREGARVRVSLATAFGCPYEGEIAPERVAGAARVLAEAGAAELVLGDTLGVADPAQVRRVLSAVAAAAPGRPLGVHLHDTLGRGLANALAAREAGARTFDTACGGLGGCPFAPGAAGNLPTLDLVLALHRLGVVTGVSTTGLVAAGRFLEATLGRSLPGRAYRALAAEDCSLPGAWCR